MKLHNLACWKVNISILKIKEMAFQFAEGMNFTHYETRLTSFYKEKVTGAFAKMLYDVSIKLDLQSFFSTCVLYMYYLYETWPRGYPQNVYSYPRKP